MRQFFHVCFLMGKSNSHVLCQTVNNDAHSHSLFTKTARMLNAFPKLLHDIYLSEEYYGENVLHMGCVAEDASLVKWLLDIGSDFHRFSKLCLLSV